MPHDFYGVPNNEISQKLMSVFSDYEVEKHNKTIEKINKKWLLNYDSKCILRKSIIRKFVLEI